MARVAGNWRAGGSSGYLVETKEMQWPDFFFVYSGSCGTAQCDYSGRIVGYSG